MIDTHSHIYLEEFDEDISEVILRAKTSGIEKIILPNIDSQSIDRMLNLKNQQPDFLFAAMGLHPTSVKENYLDELKIIENQLNEKKFIALGEIGIDLYWDKTFETEQIMAFQTQCQWALQRNLPVIIHVRNSFEATMKALKPFENSGLRGVFHSFGGTYEQANEILNFGDFYLGINGIVTFKNSNLTEVLQKIPLQRIVTETDSPYLAPVPHRGKRNESAFISLVVKKLSEVYQISENQIDKITTQNAKNLFRI
ncbi:MAG: TatD family hydrolase [Paludibacter sp.]|nr:TatD family hydrolase [Paludibacter sp.]